MPKRKVHRPSQQEIIHDCAKEVCERLAKDFGPSYATEEVLFGLNVFLQVAVDILSRRTNAGCEKEDKVDEQPE